MAEVEAQGHGLGEEEEDGDGCVGGKDGWTGDVM